MRRIFLLSPAHSGGKRAHLIRNPAATFDLARRVRDRGGAPVGEVFAFLSGLYFRGKLAYAHAYAQPSPAGVMIITPADGLVPPDQPITLADLDRYAGIPVAADEQRYRRPLERDAARVAKRLGRGAEVILLGSLATQKYLDVLQPIFDHRLRVPRDFLGRGDMSRGALLLRAVRDGRELEYIATAEAAARARVRR